MSFHYDLFYYNTLNNYSSSHMQFSTAYFSELNCYSISTAHFKTLYTTTLLFGYTVTMAKDSKQKSKLLLFKF